MWNYAELSKMAKENGGPEALIETFIAEGRKQMLPVVGIAVISGSIATVVAQKAIAYLKEKKGQSTEALEAAKKELIQGIEDYDKSQGEQSAVPDEDINVKGD